MITMTLKNCQNLTSPILGLWFGLSDLCWPFIILLESFNLRRPVVCRNVISAHYNPKNNFWIRFAILAHSDHGVIIKSSVLYARIWCAVFYFLIQADLKRQSKWLQGPCSYILRTMGNMTYSLGYSVTLQIIWILESGVIAYINRKYVSDNVTSHGTYIFSTTD